MRRLRQFVGRFLLLGMLACSTAWAQRSMTVAQLEAFIKSAVQMKQADKQVADVLKNVKLSQRLDTRTVENLQGMGAGPRTLEVLRTLSSASIGMPMPGAVVASTTPTALPPPPPSEGEKAEVLAEVTKNSLDYTAGLPNFICTQVTRRHVDYGNGFWRLADTIQEHLSFVDGKEDYKVVLINNLPVQNMAHNQLGGTTSSGEFGTMLSQIFKPETQTQFHWDAWATLRGRRAHKFSFRVLQAHSDYSIYDGESRREMIGGYHGFIWVDAETKMVMRMKMDVDGLEDFPVKAIDLDLNYDFVDISGRKYVLPLKYDLVSSRGKEGTRNEVEFRRYSRFTADSAIIFDTPDEIPKDQLEELPAQPDIR